MTVDNPSVLGELIFIKLQVAIFFPFNGCCEPFGICIIGCNSCLVFGLYSYEADLSYREAREEEARKQAEAMALWRGFNCPRLIYRLTNTYSKPSIKYIIILTNLRF